MFTRLLRQAGLGLAIVCGLGLFGSAAPASGRTHVDPILTVVVNGPGHVTSSPPGIDCHASSCSAGFPSSSKRTLPSLLVTMRSGPNLSQPPLLPWPIWMKSP